MFTSEPSLAQRIERMISDTPIVDPHTHIRCGQPGAPDLAALMSYHWVKTRADRRRDAAERTSTLASRPTSGSPPLDPYLNWRGCGTPRWPGVCSGSSATSTTSASRT